MFLFMLSSRSSSHFNNNNHLIVYFGFTLSTINQTMILSYYIVEDSLSKNAILKRVEWAAVLCWIVLCCIELCCAKFCVVLLCRLKRSRFDHHNEICLLWNGLMILFFDKFIMKIIIFIWFFFSILCFATFFTFNFIFLCYVSIHFIQFHLISIHFIPIPILFSLQFISFVYFYSCLFVYTKLVRFSCHFCCWHF